MIARLASFPAGIANQLTSLLPVEYVESLCVSDSSVPFLPFRDTRTIAGFPAPKNYVGLLMMHDRLRCATWVALEY